MQYHSHVLRYPHSKPFDVPEHRFMTFVGELVGPIVAQHPCQHYWFTHYGDYARFRVYTNNYAPLALTLSKRCGQLGLQDTGEERTLTLVDDLGHGRFLAAGRQGKNAADRALLVLRYLHSVAELVCDNVEKHSDGYWRLERSPDAENPHGSNFESLLHLFGNMTQVQINLSVSVRTAWHDAGCAVFPQRF